MNLMRFLGIAVVCASIAGCYSPPPPRPTHETVICRTNWYGAQVCTRVSNY